MADENLRPLIERLQDSIDHLAEHLGPVPQQLADFREETAESFNEVRQRLDLLETSVKTHGREIDELKR